MDGGWGYSSSSDDEIESPICSAFRTDTRFYQDYSNGDFGGDWPEHLRRCAQPNLNGTASSSQVQEATSLMKEVMKEVRDLKHNLAHTTAQQAQVSGEQWTT